MQGSMQFCLLSAWRAPKKYIKINKNVKHIEMFAEFTWWTLKKYCKLYISYFNPFVQRRKKHVWR